MTQSGESFDPYYHWLGIPPEEQPPNYYRLLGIQPFEENREVIQNAADRQMAHLRTFQNGPYGALSQTILNEVAAARLFLLSADKKAVYDRQLPDTVTSFALTPPKVRGSIPVADVPDGDGDVLPETVREPPHTGPPIVRTRSSIRAKAVGRRSKRRASRRPRLFAVTALGLLLVILAVVAVTVVMHATGRLVPPNRLVLNWPASERAGAVIKIDGRIVDLSSAVAVTADRVELSLPSGPHDYRISRPASRLLQGRFVLRPKQRLELDVMFTSNTDPELQPVGTVKLRWRPANRIDFVVLLNGKEVAFQSPAVQDGMTNVVCDVPLGSTTLKIRHNDADVVIRRFVVVPGKRMSINVDELIAGSTSRIVLEWPVADREDAILQVNGLPQVLPKGAAAELEEFAIDVDPGEYAIRVTRPGFDVFEKQITVDRGISAIQVTAHPLVSATLSEQQRRQVRDEYATTYTKYTEFDVWNSATDPHEKQLALRALLNRMLYGAERLADSSVEQYIAYEVIYQMAVDQRELVAADDASRRLRSSRYITEDEQRRRQKELWDLAVSAADFDVALAFFRTEDATGRELTVAEQTTLVNRISRSPQIREDYRTVEKIVEALKDDQRLTPAAANTLGAQILLTAAATSELAPPSLLELAETMLSRVPGLLDLERGEVALAEDLVDAANQCRRKVLADRDSTDSLRTRGDELKVSAKQLRDHINRYQRAAEARAAMTAGRETDDDHKLLGFWLLQHAQYEEALPHLALSGDSSLVTISKPLPDTAHELSELGDTIELESKKTKYMKRHRVALRAYATHVRELAILREDGTLDGDARAQLKTLIQDSSATDAPGPAS